MERRMEEESSGTQMVTFSMVSGLKTKLTASEPTPMLTALSMRVSGQTISSTAMAAKSGKMAARTKAHISWA